MSEFHQDQIRDFLRFFRTKRDLQIRELHERFADAKASQLSEGEMYTCEDVEGIVDSLSDSVSRTVREDLQLTVNMGVLAVKQLYEDADAQDVEIQMDLSKIEDVALIEAVEKIRLDAPSSGKKKSGGKLVSLRDEHQAMVTETNRLKDRNEALRREVSRLKAQYADVSEKYSGAVDDADALRRRLDSAGHRPTRGGTEESKHSGGGAVADIVAVQQLLDEERERTSEMHAELEDAKEILNRSGVDLSEWTERVQNSRQFRQLKKMLGQKNEQLLALRNRLVVYEPDATIVDEDQRNVGLHK